MIVLQIFWKTIMHSMTSKICGHLYPYEMIMYVLITNEFALHAKGGGDNLKN